RRCCVCLATARSLQRMMGRSGGLRKLVLHFDVNSTILIADPATGRTPDIALGIELSKTAYVQKSAEGQFRWHDGRSFDDPTCVSSPPSLIRDSVEDPPPWVSRNLEEFYEALRPKGSSFITTEEGKIFKPEFDRLMARLAWTGPAVDELMLSRDGSAPKSLHLVVPAFFRCLVDLKRQQRPFCVVLRTFGHDLPDLQKAFAAFASGRHPLWPGFEDPAFSFEGVSTLRWDADGRPLLTLP
ncbi:unnamed protein product, partial [Polarella glacialis]